MNKIFKVIFNRSTHQFVVVSELGKNTTQRQSLRGCIRKLSKTFFKNLVLSTSIILTLSIHTALGETTSYAPFAPQIAENYFIAPGSVAAGGNVGENGVDNVIRNTAVATGVSSVAIGDGSIVGIKYLRLSQLKSQFVPDWNGKLVYPGLIKDIANGSLLPYYLDDAGNYWTYASNIQPNVDYLLVEGSANYGPASIPISQLPSQLQPSNGQPYPNPYPMPTDQYSPYGYQAIAIGKTATAGNRWDVAIGTNALAPWRKRSYSETTYAFTYYKTDVNGQHVQKVNIPIAGFGERTALGHYASSYAMRGIAIGTEAKVGLPGEPGSFGILPSPIPGVGFIYGVDSIALGSYATSIGHLASVAIGPGSFADKTANFGLALGTGSMVAPQGGVALGAFSIADRAGLPVDWTNAKVGDRPASKISVLNGVINQNIDPMKGQVFGLGSLSDMKAIQHTAEYTRGAISVGGVGQATTGDNPKDPNTDKYHKWLGTAYGPEEEYTRQITHVAAGSTNTDAVNVAQLRGVAAVIPTYIHVNTNNPNQPSGLDPEFGGAPDANKTNHGMGNVKAGAVNPYDITIGVNAITIPDSTTSHTGQAISIGHSSTAAGSSAIAMGASAWSQMESIAIGNATQANGIASLSIGSGAKVNLDNSKNSNDYGGVAIGHNAIVNHKNGIALGDSALVSTSGGIAIGSESNADTAGGIKGFNPLSLKGKKPITPDTNAFLSTVNVGAVSVGAKSSEKTIYRQITHVAAGSKDTDAVNVAQLKDLIVLGLNVYGNENQSGTTTNGQYLGSSINIIANPANGDIQKDYSTQNLTTVYSQNPQGVGTITVKMKQKPQFQQITLGNGTNKPNTVINQQGVTITPDTKTNPQAQPVSITSGGLDNGGNQIKNVANGIPKGKTLTDAPSSNGATIGDLKHALSPLQNNTITLTGNTGATIAEKLDQKGGLNFKIAGDEDITTSASGNDVTIQLNKDTKAKIDNAADKNLSNITPAGKKVITSLGTIVAQGDNVTVKETKDKTTGQHTYTVSVNPAGKVENGNAGIVTGGTVSKALTPLKTDITELQNNTISLSADKGTTSAEKLDQAGGLNFKIIGDSDITTSASGQTVHLQLSEKIKNKFDNVADKNLSNLTPAGKKVITQLGTIVAKGDNVTVIESTDKTTGQYTYTVSVDKDLKGLDGVHIISGPSMTKSGIDAGNKVITNVAPGKITPDSKDAVNGSQIDSLGKTLGLSPDKNGTGFETPKFTPITQPDGKVGTAPTDYKNAIGNITDALNKGFIINGNAFGQGTKDGQQYLGSTLKIIGQKATSGVTYSADNLTTVYTKDAQGNGTVLIEMKEQPQFKQVTVGDGTNKPDTVINPKGVTITPDTKANPKAQPVSITSGGLDNGGNQIKNVASGLGGESIDRATGNVLKNGATIGDIKKAMQQVNAIDDKGLSFGADKAETAQGKNPVTNKLGSEVDIHGDGGNITTTVSQTDKDGIKTDIKVKLNSHITVKSITGLDNGSLKSGSTDAVNGGQIHSLSQVLGIHPKSDNSGFDAPKFDKIYGINGKPQTEDSNFTDTLNHVITTLNKGFIIHANRNLANGQQYLGSALSIIGASETGSEKDYSSTNITTVYSNSQGNGTVKIMMKDNPDFKQITVKDAAGGAKTTLNPNGIIITPSAGSDTKPVSITSKGLDNGGNQIHNVAAGSAKNDAVNKGQLDNVVTKAINQSTTDLTDKGLKFNGNEGGPVTNKLGSEIDIKGAGTKADSAYSGENIKTKVSQQNGNTAIDIMLANDLENLSGIHIKNGPSMTEKGINAGGKVITNVGETYKDMHAAATVGQLKKLYLDIKHGEALPAKGLDFSADTGGYVNNPLGSTVEVLGDGSNIQTHIEKTKDEKTKININLSDHIHVKQITIQDTPEQGSTTINDHGVTVKSADGKQVSVTDKGLDNGGNVISNVAEGKTPTDAVNVKQLNVLSNEINTLKNSMGGDIGKALRDMRHQIKQNRKESNAGSASAIAAANLPQPFSAGRSIVGAAIGSYRNQQAISIGASRISDNGKWIIRSSITQDTQHNFGAGMGFGYQW